MQIQQVNRTDAEKIFLIIKNVEANSITTGMGAALIHTGVASIDGVQAVKVTAALAKGFVGYAVQDIASNAYGLVQCWGYCNSVQLSNSTTSVTVTSGDNLQPGAVAGTMATLLLNEGISTLAYRYSILANTPNTISSAPMWVSALVRAL